MPDGLFRKTAVEARCQHQYAGHGADAPPAAHWLLAAVAVLTVAAIALLLLRGSYAPSMQVRGYLVPASGTVRVFAPRSGIVVDRYVAEGHYVIAGAALLELGTERVTNGVNVDTRIIAALEAELAGIDGQLQRLAGRYQQQREVIAAQRVADRDNLELLQSQLELHDAGSMLANRRLARVEDLAANGHLAADDLQQRRIAQLAREQRRAELAGQLAQLQAAAEARTLEETGLPMRRRDEQAQLQAARLRLERELTSARSMAALTINAPTAGVVSGLALRQGDRVTAAVPLLTIVPTDADYSAVLFVPSRSRGFIDVGDAIRVRVDAYPHQKFGVVPGAVKRISQTPVLAGEVKAPVPVSETSYRVDIALQANALMSGGETLQLVPGMTVVADISRERRRIIEWLIAPLNFARRS